MRLLIGDRDKNGTACLRFVLFLLFGCLFFSSLAAAAESEYVKPRLAVVAFESKNADEATIQAVTDLVQSRFENADLYVMVERAQVEKVFKEQSFQLTGAVDEASAIKIGKMLGASKLVLGSINRVDQGFMTSGRIVDVESGRIEIAANEYSKTALELRDSVEELVKSLVQKDRSRFQEYLERTAPDRETIEIYVSGSTPYFIPGASVRTVTKTDYFSNFSGSYQVDFATEKGDANTKLGGGVRYFFWKKYFVDLGYAGSASGNARSKMNAQACTLRTTYGTQFSGSINRLWPIARKTSLWGGAGIIRSSYYVEVLGGRQERIASGGDSVIFDLAYADTGKQDFMLYPVTVGVEWKPLRRFGVSCAASYIIGSIPAGKVNGKGYLFKNGDNFNPVESIQYPFTVFSPEVQPIVISLMTSLSF